MDSTIKDKYKPYNGNRSFSAIEVQQDRKQLPLTNNAVVYEDDLDITPGPAFRLNGRIFTNSNFLPESQQIKIPEILDSFRLVVYSPATMNAKMAKLSSVAMLPQMALQLLVSKGEAL